MALGMHVTAVALETYWSPNSPVKKVYKDVLTGKYNFQPSKQAHLRDTAFYWVIL